MKQLYYYDKEMDDISTADGVLYDTESLEDMSTECKQRLARLHTDHPEYDWLAASRILISEGLLEPF